ncbi:hypothetical protein LV89_03225 [Arcicella aurantiaca]|uniref:Uncharacterized protein n=1 Tax=Arcicella aurantiaca TaxID=591202 RepID=A0A316E0E6_9BACT|nr:hypothetical protein [Arcicella aurantiaca]PWK22959.1 hypothetical protein LV89_03225 [Arcicella aurantiaca]
MKSLSITILLALFISITLSSFKSLNNNFDDEDYDTLNYHSMNISGVKLGTNYGIILEKFGSPDSVRKEETPDAQNANHFEMYRYGKDAFYVMDDNVSGFELETARFSLENLGGLKVGDPMSKVKKRFPKSYKLRDVDNTEEDWVTIISVQFGTSDSFLEITVQNDKIVGLATVTDDGTDEQ